MTIFLKKLKKLVKKKFLSLSLCEKCPNTELFLVRIFLSEYRKIRTRNNSVFGQFSRSVWLDYSIRFCSHLLIFSTSYKLPKSTLPNHPQLQPCYLFLINLSCPEQKTKASLPECNRLLIILYFDGKKENFKTFCVFLLGYEMLFLCNLKGKSWHTHYLKFLWWLDDSTRF